MYLKLLNSFACALMLGASSIVCAVQHHEVTIATENAEIRLAGTLSLPDSDAPAPVVLFITGSGDHTRDQIISGAPMFKQIADHLLAQGIATLRLDDRGTGESTGPSTNDSTTADRVADMRAAVAYLRQQQMLQASAIGLLGHSEGATIAAELAANDPAISWVILLGAPAQRGQTVWLDQQIAGLRAHLGPEHANLAESEQLLRQVTELSINGATAEAFEPLALRMFELAGMPLDQVRESGMLSQFGERMSSAWMRYFLAHDPSKALRTLRQPALLLYGALDDLTRPAINAAPLVQALADAGNQDVAVRLLPQQDHFFLRGEGLPPGEHAFGKMQVAPELLKVVGAWIAERQPLVN